MVTRLHLFIIIALSILLTSVVLIMYTQQREREFLDNQLVVQQAMVDGAARDIQYRLNEQSRLVALFSDEYRRQINQLTYHPGDQYIAAIINKRLQERFPYVDSFSITSTSGEPIIDDFEGNIGDVCKRDISSFSTEVKRLHNPTTVHNAIFIHPQAGRYHYDIMSPVWNAANQQYVFLVSFKPDSLQHILKTREIPGYKLLLTKLYDSSLIEVSGEGTRDIIGRDGRLSKTELMSIKASKSIPNTEWSLINLQDPTYEQSYINKLWKEAGGILLIVIITNLLVFMIFSTRIKYAEIRNRQQQNKTYPWVKH